MRADLRRFVAAGLFVALAVGGPLAAAHGDDAAPADPVTVEVTAEPDPDQTAPEPLPEAAGSFPSSPTPASEPLPDEVETSPPSTDTPGDPTTTVTLKNAQFRWGFNTLLHRKPHDGKNFLTAGLMPDTHGDRMTSNLWKQSERVVRIERASGTSYVPATWDRFGDGTDHQVVIDGGTGTVDAAARTARIVWRGSFGVARYTGMTAFSVTDPVLVVENGVGRLEATLSGFGVSRDGNGAGDVSGPIGPTTAVLAQLGAVDLSTPGGLTMNPVFYGVRSGHPEQKVDDQGRWGSFPTSFIQFVDQVGQAPFWMTSGSDDSFKPAAAVFVSFDAAAPVVVKPPAAAPATKKPKVSNPTSKAPPAKSADVPRAAPAPAVTAPRTAPAINTAPPTSDPVSAAFINSASLTAAAPVVRVVPDGKTSDLGWWLAAAFLLMSAAAVAAPSLLTRPRDA